MLHYLKKYPLSLIITAIILYLSFYNDKKELITMRKGIPCTVIRGGTSKGLYLMEKDIPAPGAARDKVLLRLMGSPDPRQIDGLGGATSVTSKVAIIAPSSRPDADVDYTFAQVNITRPSVSYAGNCGNISSGVGLFAIEQGLITVADGPVTVRIFNTNTQSQSNVVGYFFVPMSAQFFLINNRGYSSLIAPNVNTSKKL